jgi:hypothetical protein
MAAANRGLSPETPDLPPVPAWAPVFVGKGENSNGVLGPGFWSPPEPGFGDHHVNTVDCEAVGPG